MEITLFYIEENSIDSSHDIALASESLAYNQQK